MPPKVDSGFVKADSGNHPKILIYYCKICFEARTWKFFNEKSEKSNNSKFNV